LLGHNCLPDRAKGPNRADKATRHFVTGAQTSKLAGKGAVLDEVVDVFWSGF
jgi:hypothetical protein